MALSTVRFAQRGKKSSPEKGAQNEKTVIANAIRSIARELRSSGLGAEGHNGVTKAQLDVLKALQGKSGLSINELADRTYTHQSSVSTLVGKLEADGLVNRQTSQSDARRVSVTITPSGRSALRNAPRSSEERLLKALGHLNASELADLAGCLSKLSSLLDDSSS